MLTLPVEDLSLLASRWSVHNVVGVSDPADTAGIAAHLYAMLLQEGQNSLDTWAGYAYICAPIAHPEAVIHRLPFSSVAVADAWAIAAHDCCDVAVASADLAYRASCSPGLSPAVCPRASPGAQRLLRSLDVQGPQAPSARFPGGTLVWNLITVHRKLQA